MEDEKLGMQFVTDELGKKKLIVSQTDKSKTYGKVILARFAFRDR